MDDDIEAMGRVQLIAEIKKLRADRSGFHTCGSVAQPITRAANRYDVSRRLGVVSESLPQGGQMSLDGAALGSGGIAPYFAEQLRAGDDTAARTDQRGQQVELFRPEVDRFRPEAYDPRREVDAELADFHRLRDGGS